MTAAFALDIIPRRMKELGYYQGYVMRLRHFQVDKNDTLIIDAQNEYYYLIEPTEAIEVSSKMGMYNVGEYRINEMIYEHQGNIKVKNLTTLQAFAVFIQVIPNHTND